MNYIVRCIDIAKSKKCPTACQVLHGPLIYCTVYKEGTNGTIVRPCER